MAIYRPRTRRWPLLTAVGFLALASGFALGWGLGAGREPDPAEALALLRSSVTTAAGTLEVVEVEYRESVQDGRIVSSPEYQGARDALGRSHERYLEVREALRALDPGLVGRADALFSRLERLLRDRAPVEEVSEATQELADLLRGAVGGGS
jgi:hypothetical protein